jgi:hypothetical protein
MRDKESDARMIELEIKAKIEQEERRVQLVREREEKTQKIMQKMQDLVRGDKDNELRLKAERDYIKECLEKDEQARLADLAKKQ